MKILSIDVGFKNPAFVIINIIGERVKLNIYRNIYFEKVDDSIKILDFFLRKKIDMVIIEHQHFFRNVSLQWFIKGFFVGNNIKTVLTRPISFLNKNNKTRFDKKIFSINLINNILKKNHINFSFTSSDEADAINQAFYYIYKNKIFFKIIHKIDKIKIYKFIS